MKKVLILGADGNLGEQLKIEFSKKKEYDLVLFSKKDLNLLDRYLIIPKISKTKPDIIINTAAYNLVDKCEDLSKEFRLAKKINGDALRYLGRAAIKNDAILVHYSSDYVFGGNISGVDDPFDETLLAYKEKGGFREDEKPCPINKYGETKAMGEREVQRLAEKKLKYYLIRTSKLFGPKGKSDDAKENFFDLMLKIAPEQKEIKVVNEELSCFTYTPDLARETRKLIEEEKDFGIYHITNNDPAIWFDAASELFRFKKINVRLRPVLSKDFPRPAKRPKYSVLANSKIEPLRSWKEALRDYLKK